MKPQNKPRVGFCWLCGHRLWGKQHIVITLIIDGHDRILHKSCAKRWAKELAEDNLPFIRHDSTKKD